jgi:hypothetical protein
LLNKQYLINGKIHGPYLTYYENGNVMDSAIIINNKILSHYYYTSDMKLNRTGVGNCFCYYQYYTSGDLFEKFCVSEYKINNRTDYVRDSSIIYKNEEEVFKLIYYNDSVYFYSKNKLYDTKTKINSYYYYKLEIKNKIGIDTILVPWLFN